MDYERLLLENLGTIEQIVGYVARRHRLSRDEAEELQSGARLKIIEKDYEVLRRFEGRSSLRTYLTAVILRFFLDTRIEQWGKWRPSMQARRLGPIALLLERLLTRDGLHFDEAFEVMRTHHRIEISREGLEAIAIQLPPRATRRFIGEDHLAEVAASAQVDATERLNHMKQADRIEEAMAAALLRLDDEDRLILKMRFQDNLQISRIARVLGLEQKPLYRRLERTLAELRRELESRGVDREQAGAIVGDPATELNHLMEWDLPGKRMERPSL